MSLKKTAAELREYAQQRGLRKTAQAWLRKWDEVRRNAGKLSPTATEVAQTFRKLPQGAVIPNGFGNPSYNRSPIPGNLSDFLQARKEFYNPAAVEALHNIKKLRQEALPLREALRQYADKNVFFRGQDPRFPGSTKNYRPDFSAWQVGAEKEFAPGTRFITKHPLLAPIYGSKLQVGDLTALASQLGDGRIKFTPLIHGSDPTYRQLWLQKFNTDPAFAKQVKDVWKGKGYLAPAFRGHEAVVPTKALSGTILDTLKIMEEWTPKRGGVPYDIAQGSALDSVTKLLRIPQTSFYGADTTLP